MPVLLLRRFSASHVTASSAHLFAWGKQSFLRSAAVIHEQQGHGYEAHQCWHARTHVHMHVHISTHTRAHT
eukprot:1152225-Pelagomonas_calceolata.AAC.5